MRRYLQDSPQAAARIVALTLVSDGQLKKSELEALEFIGAHAQLGLSRAEMRGIVHEFCADLLLQAERSGEADCRIEPWMIEQVFGEVEQPRLRRQVLALCIAVIHADGQVHEGEAIVLLAAIEHWGVRPELMASLGATSPSPAIWPSPSPRPHASMRPSLGLS